MNCAWNAYLNLLPDWLRIFVDKNGSEQLEELRLRRGLFPELILQKGSVFIDRPVSSEDLTYVINAASRYSPWSASSAASGYITAKGGHRIGICGKVVVHNGVITGISQPNSLCIRVARDYCGIARKISGLKGSVLLIGPPGSGKTTLLRDMIRQVSRNNIRSICVVDERGELFPVSDSGFCFDTGPRTDILTGCDKSDGIEIALRVMGPEIIAVDEVTAKRDCEALIHAGWCGVRLLATAHAANATDLYNRPVYKPLVESRLFDYLFVLHPDKSLTHERMRNAD